jgi:hypothetical protein
MQLETEHVNEDELDSFLIAAVKAWLRRRKVDREETQPAWAEAFQESAVAFVDQLIDENRSLFEELSQL